MFSKKKKQKTKLIYAAIYNDLNVYKTYKWMQQNEHLCAKNLSNFCVFGMKLIIILIIIIIWIIKTKILIYFLL